MRTQSASRARRRERGEVSWVGLLMLLALAAGGYVAWVWVPVFAKQQQVEEIVRLVSNAAVRNSDDAALVADLVQRVQALEAVEVQDEAGRVAVVPLVALDPRAVAWERDPVGRRLRIAFSYTLPVVYPWIDRRDERAVDVEHVADITPPNWGDK